MNTTNKTIAKLLRNLAKTLDAYTNTVPTFAPSDAVACLRKGGFTEQADVIESTERKAFDKEHGDTEKTINKELLTLLNNGMRDIVSETGIGMASTSRKDRVILTDEQRKEVVDIRRAYLAEKEKDEGQRDQTVIQAGQLGQIASKFNVSVPTVSKLLDDAGLTNKRETAAV